MKHSRGTPPRRRGTLLVALVAGAALVMPTTSAFAHVTVNPREAVQGGYSKLSFRVPNERDGVSTTKLEVNFPSDQPFASVSVRPHAGWTYDVVKSKLAAPIKSDDGDISEGVTKITWTGGAIKPGEFDEFEVSVGPLPDDVDALTFKALQTYSDGEIVRWIDVAAPGGAAVDHPAPVLKLTAAAAATTATTAPLQASQGGEVTDKTTNAASTNAVSTNAASKNDVDTARTFGILGLVFGLLGFTSATAAWRKRRSAP
ncbi:MAG TPA: YcnI family protein [Acidimicrobiia bacterium]|nr:YcnI family protein [Acidimicrobiia bacterium]